MSEKKTLPKTEEKKSAWQGYRCYVTYHPSAVLEGGYQFEEKILNDFARHTKATKRPPANAAPDGSKPYLGFDTEYDRDSRLLTVGISDGAKAAAFETTETGWKKTLAASVKKAKVLVGHSVAGDLDYLVRLGLAKDDWLAGRHVRDSFLLARMHNENGGKGAYGLETLLLSEFNAAGWKADTEKLIKKTGNAADWSPEQRVARCRLDAWATVVLAKHYEEKLNGGRRPAHKRGDST